MIVRELLARFGVSYDDSGARKAERDVEGLKGGLRELIGLVGGAALVRGFGRFLVQQVQLADAVGDTAERLGVGVEALQELRFAGQDVGMSLDGVDSALGRLIRGTAEAARGQGEAKDAFRELGVSLTDQQGNLRSFDDVLAQVADGLGGTATDADRLRLAYKIFGREGAAFASTMKEGSKGLEDLRLRARELGGVLSQEQVDAADKADKAIQGFGAALGGVKQQIASQFLPSLTAGLGKISKWLSTMREVVRNSNIVVGAVGAAGLALATMIGASRLAMLTKAGLAFGIIALAIDDIATYAKGGDSLIGRFLDKFGGLGSSVVHLENWKAGLKILAEYAESFAKNLAAGWQVLQQWNAQRAADKEKARRAEFEQQHKQWERRKKWVDEHPNLPEFLRHVPAEPVWKPSDAPDGSAWDELRTRQVATTQGMGQGPLAVPGGAQSAEDIAAERARLVAAAAAQRSAASAVAVQRNAGQAAPANVQQSVTVNVEGGGMDKRELADMVGTTVRKELTQQNANNLRSTRQVAP